MRKDNDFIYWKEAKAEFIGMIDSMVLDVMAAPVFTGKKQDGTDMTMAEISNRNSLIAMHNEGARELARALKAELEQEEDVDD